MPLLPNKNDVAKGSTMDQGKKKAGGPLDLDGDGKQSSQETAIGVALVIVGGALAGYLMYLTTTGQVTEETIKPLIVILAWITGREGVKRLTGV
jgi:ABC-type nitrate/sulfonate/bicarbonate transport system permease component